MSVCLSVCSASLSQALNLHLSLSGLSQVCLRSLSGLSPDLFKLSNLTSQDRRSLKLLRLVILKVTTSDFTFKDREYLKLTGLVIFIPRDDPCFWRNIPKAEQDTSNLTCAGGQIRQIKQYGGIKYEQPGIFQHLCDKSSIKRPM